jgi:hypothetical protein
MILRYSGRCYKVINGEKPRRHSYTFECRDIDSQRNPEGRSNAYPVSIGK